MKIAVDYEKCAGLGICESLAPDVFEVDDGGDMNLHEDAITPGLDDALHEAVASCPTGALSVVR